MSNLYRLLPSVDACLQCLNDTPLCQGSIKVLPQTLVKNAVNDFLQGLRNKIKQNDLQAEDLQREDLELKLINYVLNKTKPVLKHVINATGVVIHTNLGRSVLAQEAIEAMQIAAQGYCNLEFDLESGERGSRHSLIEKDICQLTGAESALVVNNNAAAVLLMLNTLCQGGESIVSRGQLVEIGGSFRIPDVMEKSGSVLKEVGTTNKCHKADYINAINENTKALVRIHTSNYRVIGFHSDVSTKDMAEIAHSHNLPLLEDLGSGSLVDFSPYGLTGEPTVKDVLADGVDVVTFSGDKVLGGPQAGIIAGKKEFIDKIKKNQLLRALRCDKLTLAALEATLRLYYEPKEALKKIPTLRRMTISQDELKQRAQKLRKMLTNALPSDKVNFKIKAHVSRVGGGSFPENDLPTYVVCMRFIDKDSSIKNHSANTLKQHLLSTSPPVVGRIENDDFVFDVRTLADHEFGLLTKILSESIS